MKIDRMLTMISRIRQLNVEEEQFKRRSKSYHELELESKKGTSQISITLKFSQQVRARVLDMFDPESIEELSTGEQIVSK